VVDFVLDVSAQDLFANLKRPVMAKRLLVLLALFIVASAANWALAADQALRVLVWDERQPAQKKAYDNFLGNAIADFLAKQPGISVKSVSLDSPGQGLDSATLDATDVIVWWGHARHDKVTSEHADAVVKRVLAGRLGFVGLHSTQFAEPFMRLMYERAKADAPNMVPEAERATAKFDFSLPLKREKVKRDQPLTPRLEKIGDNTWRLIPPACVFPSWREDGAPSHLKVLLPEHPLAKGLPASWYIPHTEMYEDPFHVPAPDATVFEEHWDKGEHFKSGLIWHIGQGRVVYFRPGHETYPVYRQEENLRVVENAVRWLGRPEEETKRP
jgi:trehalose utilization protein